MPSIVIPTAQNIELEYPIAPLGYRLGAALIDLLLMAGYWLLLYLVFDFAAISPLIGFTVGATPTQQFAWLPITFYPLVCNVLLDGQTLGKKALRLRVIHLEGTPLDFSAYLLRWFFRLIDIVLMFGVIGIIAMAVTPRGQRLGDIAARTTVVRLRLLTQFEDTMFRELEADYEIQFPEVKRLTDRDIAIMKQVLDASLRQRNGEVLNRLRNRICEVMEVSSELGDEAFLEAVLRDYNAMYGGA